jgi:thiamine-phosphate pyrophosphorylase
LRVKEVGEHELARLAEPLQRICADSDVAFIVNDSAALAKGLAPTACILARATGDLREARVLLGPWPPKLARPVTIAATWRWEAGEAGADYVAFGAFYPTTTKPSDYRPHPAILSWGASIFEIALCRDRRDHA